ncbi:MAG: archease [Gammaproteobacteria bacterium]
MSTLITEDNYFDHDADIGIIGRGYSLEECFVNAAQAVFALMTDLSAVRSVESVAFEFIEADIELAFVTWLNLLIAKSNADNLIFSQFKITRKNNEWHCQAAGEKWNDTFERGIDVKGATLTMLSIKQNLGFWEGRCVVDV